MNFANYIDSFSPDVNPSVQWRIIYAYIIN